MSTCLISVEGVLGEHSQVHGFHPIVDGVRLARALRGEYRMMLSTTGVDTDSVDFWLRINGMVQPSFHDGLLCREPVWADLTDAALLAQHAAQLRASGDNLGLVVSSDPEGLLEITAAGLPCLFFINPSYRWAAYRPDRKRLPRPWQDIHDEVTRQAELKATDPRLTEESA